MLERLVAWVLNNYLGKYVENLNTDQLSIALLRGSVELENLPLKKDALRHFGLPIKLKSGFIGKIRLKIPVTKIKSAPWHICIEDVTVIVSPIHLSEWDKDLEEQAAHEYKLGLLDSMEAVWRTSKNNAQQDSSGYYASSYNSWFSYGSGLVTTIIDNLQLEIKDVHFRYEDNLSIDKESFAIGVSIDSLLVQSCNEKWEPGFHYWDPNTKYSYQLLQLNGFSVYWDSIPVSQFWGDLDLAQLAMTSKTHTSPGHNYILLPVSGKTRVKRNRSVAPLRSRSHPRIVCDLQLECVSFSLSDVQYSEMIGCVKNLNSVQQCQKFIHLRPISSVKEDARSWWIYAFNCIKIENRGSLSQYIDWDSCLQRAKENVAYVKLYTIILSSPVGANVNLSPDLKELRNKIEWDRGFEELRALREVAMLAVRPPPAAPVEEKAKSEGGSTLLRWFPQWRGWYSSSTKETNAETPVPAIEDIKIDEDKKLGQLEDEILDVLADTVENNTLLRRDTVFGQFNFELKEGTFSLISSMKNMMELQFNTLKLELESRPRTSSSRICISLGGITLHDRLSVNSIFPILISPQNSDNAPSSKMNRNVPPTVAKLLLNQTSMLTGSTTNSLFQLLYEVNPFNSTFDYRFHIWTQSLDMVYNPEATRWLVEFFTKPHQSFNYDKLREAAKQQYNAMKQRTKEEIMKNWDKILHGDMLNERKYWDVKLDICAPQIFLVERFADKNTIVCVVDFGKLYFTNRQTALEEADSNNSNVTIDVQKSASNDSDDSNDEFATPCSTPPESDNEVSSVSQKSLDDLVKSRSAEKRQSLSNVLYDNYKMEFSELQILLGRIKDNWKFAHLKGTSSLHVLDRFNITLQIARRVFHTNDPDYPALKVYGTLPKLVVHTNEQKIQALCTISETVSANQNAQSPYSSEEDIDLDVNKSVEISKPIETVNAEDIYNNPESKLLMIQFIVSHLALEVQSRGRCIAELQVSGVTATFTKQLYVTNLILSVHSLLLVDALQTFGPDFELLVASHKHIGMDSISGSLRDSDPTSPTSPGSPNLSSSRSCQQLSLTHELNNMIDFHDGSIADNELQNRSRPTVSPNEALILIELVFIKHNPGSEAKINEDVQKASIQFNNLDIVANQETIVELISFFKRILTQVESARLKSRAFINTNGDNSFISSPKIIKPDSQKCSTPAPAPLVQSSPLTTVSSAGITKTEVIFNFHRLNILLLRSVASDGGTVIAKKIATATMMDAKVHAVVDEKLFIEGSLGGIQILDLTSNGQIHQRILSVGQDPLRADCGGNSKEKRTTGSLFDDISADIYNVRTKIPKKMLDGNVERIQAFSFTVTRLLYDKPKDSNEVDINVRFSSALYTHAPHFVSELSSYATEFKQYLKNLARSIGSAATEMAIGLVHAKAETIAQSLSINNRFTFYGSTNELSSAVRKSKLAMSTEQGLDSDYYDINALSGSDEETQALNIKLDVVIDTPVVILPRFATSFEVFVVHLGRITVSKGVDADEVTGNEGSLWSVEKYVIEIRDMNLYSLDTRNRFQLFSYKNNDSATTFDFPFLRAEDIYACAVDAKPVLHDTLIQLCIEQDTKLKNDNISEQTNNSQNFQVTGKIINPLKVSLGRQQYEQLLQTVETFVAEPLEEEDKTSGKESNEKEETANKSLLADIDEEGELHTGISALDLDPALRARMLVSHSSMSNLEVEDEKDSFVTMKVCFAIPSFTVELKGDFGNGEQSLVDVSFRDFLLHFEKSSPYQTEMEVSLQSLLMEDLQREPNSKHRYMMTSSVNNSSFPYSTDYVSISCPNLSVPYNNSVVSSSGRLHSSLPNYLQTETVFGGFSDVSSKNKSSGIQMKTSRSGSKRETTTTGGGSYPSTPPPSPRERRYSSEINSEENLVHIKITSFNKNSDIFQQKKLSKAITINFNTLNMIFNIESWVIVLDFFGVGAGTEETNDSPLSISKTPSVHSKSIARDNATKSYAAPTEIDERDHCIQCMELSIRVKSLSVILNRTDNEVACANMSKLSADIIKNSNSALIGDVVIVEGEIGSLRLFDLTPGHNKLYSERFLTSDLCLSLKRYSKPDRLFVRENDTYLKLAFPVMIYTHTQRFIFEIQSYFKHFTRLQAVLSTLRSSAKLDEDNLPSRIQLDINAESPVIILPVSSQLPETLIIDLGTLSVTNNFKWTSPDNLMTTTDETKLCLLDAMEIKLSNIKVNTGKRESLADHPDKHNLQNNKSDFLVVGTYFINKGKPSLLENNCELELKIERNLTTACKIVPDISIKGVLSALSIAITLPQFKLLRGLLAYNLGESVDDLQDEEILTFNQEPLVTEESTWITNFMQIDLVNVTVKLLSDDNMAQARALASIDFIKSRFLVESHSDKSQEIDLISQEIIITDTRFSGDVAGSSKSNVFTNILQPLNSTSTDGNIRVELHLRKRTNKQEFTLLLNNMRLMAIVEWWEMLRDFVTTEPDFVLSPESSDQKSDIQTKNVSQQSSPQPSIPFELKLNISDSEIVLIEDTSQWDANAVIFKSTMVINYKPEHSSKPLACNLHHCEMFSCILGMEDETALSIIDPVNITCEITTSSQSNSLEPVKVLQVISQQLCFRLSYNDVRMFLKIYESLPNQQKTAEQNKIDLLDIADDMKRQLKQLMVLGFSLNDCFVALEKCNRIADDAVLWLTENAVPEEQTASSSKESSSQAAADSVTSAETDVITQQSSFAFEHVQIKTDCFSVCIIDDCRDSDVPLLELLMNNLEFKMDMQLSSSSLRCIFSIDYYNRFLSGWEPFIESWCCNVTLAKTLGSDLLPNHLMAHIKAHKVLNINITRTFLQICEKVKETWTQDYYSLKEGKNDVNSETGSSGGSLFQNYRRRSPFIPFALKNNTGSRLWYITSVTTGNSFSTAEVDVAQEISEDVRWICVDNDNVVSFSFEGQGKLRHRDTHKIRSHQIVIKVDGYQPMKPVSVDRVGVYFRHALSNSNNVGDSSSARIVFDVTLEGSARKLITVRSALLLNNQLEAPIEVKLEKPLIYSGALPPNYWLIIQPGKFESVPLTHTHSQIYVRPVTAEGTVNQQLYAFCSPPINWQNVTKSGDVVEQIRECPNNKGSSYRMYAVIRHENYPTEDKVTTYSALPHPAHVITFLSPMIIINLLPYDLEFNVNEIETGRIPPGQKLALHEVNPNIVTEIHFSLENYPKDGKLIIPSSPSSFESKIQLQDRLGRRLNLRASIIVQRGSEIKVTIFAQYWIINKTSLPLIFRQEGVVAESAGQYEEHELARMIAPLMLSLTDLDASPSIAARVGNGVHKNGVPQWCQHFQLNTGVQVRKLKVSMRDNRRSDIVYMIGINVTQGHGRYRNTYIVTLTSHYQIYNMTTYTLEISQKSSSTTSNTTMDDNCIKAIPNCFLPFHWPQQDKDQLLCLKIKDIPNCCWSGGFKIKSDAFHINIRDIADQMYFIRVEIVLQDATFFIIFTNAETIPPPIRIDNFSDVPLQFHQSGCTKLGTVRARSSVSYAWDEPTYTQRLLTIAAPGGVTAHYDADWLGKATQLTYENFIYIAFSATFNKASENEINFDPLNVRCQQLVLDVIENCVVLNRKEDGARSQLWRMTADGLIQHEGSSPPTDPTSKSPPPKNALVLDISSPGIKPTEYVNLCLQKVNKRRKLTQTWHFTEEGRLCCAHNNLCVQARDGFFGLRKGNEAVLGPMHVAVDSSTGIPPEEMITRQRLRPGSGCLEVNIITDGPTRVINVVDVKNKRNFSLVKDGDWISFEKIRMPSQESDQPSKQQEFEIKVELIHGIGLSLISNHPPEELLFTRLAGINFYFCRTKLKETVELAVKDIQIDNQLFDAQCPVMLYVTPSSRNKDADELSKPAIHAVSERMLPIDPNTVSNAEIFKVLILEIKNLSVMLEDRLLLKLFAFAGYSVPEQDHKNMQENDFEVQRLLADMVAVNTKRYYFETIKLILGQIRLSVMTSNKLPPELREIKKKINLTLIKFEDANIDLKPFTKQHVFETNKFLTNLIRKHFENELKWQAAIILGSVDFLGNPLGFVNDISEGVSGLIYEGNIGGLVQNVAHGLSNSAAKVTGTLSDGLGVISMDDDHQEGRQRIRRQHPSGSGHIVAGLKGFGHGIVGGMTSVFKQTYEGASNEGVQGFITGLGKGLVGTVTKPVVGVLDLASETASAVRDSSRSKTVPNRIRKPRCVVGPTGLLPVHSDIQSLGQEYLYTINNRNYSEKFIAYEILRSSGDDLQIIISTEKVRVFSCSAGSVKGCSVVIEASLSDVCYCQPLIQDGFMEHLYYVELIVSEVTSDGKEKVKRPKIRCDNEQLATWVSEQVNYAKNMYVEKQHTLISTVNIDE